MNELFLILCTISGGAAFFYVYRRGLKDGLALKDNKPLPAIKTPVRIIEEIKENQEIKKESDDFSQELEYLLTYDGTPQKKAVV